MKKSNYIFITAMTISVFFILIFIGCNIKTDKDSVTIDVYNFGEFISSGFEGTLNTNKEFTEITGIKVNYSTFATNEELYAKLASKGTDFDVIIVSDYMVSKLISEGKLSKLDFQAIPNAELIDSDFLYPNYDPENLYSVPYTWGCIGLFYNKSMVSETQDKINWDILWNEKYKGKILMFDSARESFAIAQKRLGIDFNSEDPGDWYKAFYELEKQKPLVQAYVMDQIFNKMGNDEAALAPYYAGDAVLLLKENKNLGFVIPEEGTNVFVDAMCVPEVSRHKQEAFQYINFMCDLEVAKANVLATGYSTPITKVRESLDRGITENKNYYPDKNVLDNSESFKNLPNSITQLIDNLWVRLKVGDTNKTGELIIIFISFSLIYVAVVVYKNIRKNR